MNGSSVLPTAPPQRRIRVLHVITRMIVGGAQRNTLLSCALIDPGRFESTLLTGTETGPEGDLLAEAEARGVVVHREPWLVREVDPLRDLVALARLVRFIRRGRFDIVHTHAAKAGILGRLAARIAGAPVVFHTGHSVPFHRAQSKRRQVVFAALERLAAPFTDGIVVVGRAVETQSLALGIGRRGQYHLIRSGIELGSFRAPGVDRAEARRALGLPPDAFVVGTVGRLSPQKAPLDLIAAFATFARGRPAAHLVVAGDGSLRARVERAVADTALGDRVHLLGLRHDVPRLLPAFDVLALSSLYEGLPRVLPEAMAAGLPIVATRVDGVEEAVRCGVNGWLVEPGDVAALADRLAAIAADPVEARRMGARGRERVAEFSATLMVDELATLYGRLLARKRLGRRATDLPSSEYRGRASLASTRR